MQRSSSKARSRQAHAPAYAEVLQSPAPHEIFWVIFWPVSKNADSCSQKQYYSVHVVTQVFFGFLFTCMNFYEHL